MLFNGVFIYIPEKVYIMQYQNVESGIDICVKGAYIVLRCELCEKFRNIQLKCNLLELRSSHCDFCRVLRRKRILGKALARYKKIKFKGDKLILWTFGSSLHDNEINRRLIRNYWYLFVRRLKKISKNFDPLMNCMESGSRGDRLHYHIVGRGFLDHEKVLEIWRSITKEKSNVNFSRKISSRNSYQAFAYLAKYASKGYKYYWMGSMLKIGTVDTMYTFKESEQCAHSWKFAVLIPYGYGWLFQTKLDLTN